MEGIIRGLHRRHKGRNRFRVGGVRGTNLSARTDGRAGGQTARGRIMLLNKATPWANVLGIFSHAPARRRPLDTERRRVWLLIINVFFWHFDIFFSSGRGSFLVHSAPWNAGSRPEHHGARVGLGRRPWHVLWGVKVASPHGEAFQARRAIQAPANLRTG